MATQESNPPMPPLLLHGGCIEFVDLSHFVSVKERELCAGRVTVIDRVGVGVGDRIAVQFRVGQKTLGESFEANVVYFEGGVAGLAVDFAEQTLDAMVELCEPQTVKTGAVTRPPDARADAQTSQPSLRQGEIRHAQTAADELLKREQTTLFSLFRDLQFEGQVGRLTLVSGSVNWQFEFSQQATIVDFTMVDPNPFVSEGLIPVEVLDRLPKNVMLADLFGGFGLDALTRSSDGRRAFNRASFAALKISLRQIEQGRDVRWFFEQGRRGLPFWTGIPFMVYGAEWITRRTASMKFHELDAIYEFRKAFYPTLIEMEDWSVERLALDEAEKRFVHGALQKQYTFRKLLTASPIGRRKTIEFLTLLATLRLLEFRREPTIAEDTGGVVAMLESRLERGRVGHFEALEVHASAHPDEFPEALDRLDRLFGAKGRFRTANKDSARLCDGILADARQAMDFLSDQARRVEYRKGLYSTTELTGFAQLLLDKLKLAVMREDNRMALRLKEMAIELAPRVAKQELPSIFQSASEEGDNPPS